MARGTNQKLKLLYLMKILLEQTDDTHWLTLQELLAELRRYGVTAERKSIYTDFEALRMFGLDILKEQKNKTYYYHVGSRDFEIAELKLLVDAVQSSKFITEKKSRELIQKLEKFASRNEAKQLHRQVYVQGRVKTMNESIYYNVDKIHAAISNHVQIKFQYYQWDRNKNMVLRHEGAYYCISPWELLWDDENYYLVGYDSKEHMIKHFRVDKMLKISLLETPAEGEEYVRELDMASYSSKRFGMFDGEEQMVRIEFENHFAGVVIDRFGKDVVMRPVDKGHFVANVEIAVSRQFIHWVMALGDGARITGPEHVVKTVKEEVQRLLGQYDEIRR